MKDSYLERTKQLFANMNETATFLRYIRLGEKYGYPKCCVMQFARECIEGKEPYMLRGRGIDNSFVPCDQCIKESIEDGFHKKYKNIMSEKDILEMLKNKSGVQ